MPAEDTRLLDQRQRTILLTASLLSFVFEQVLPRSLGFIRRHSGWGGLCTHSWFVSQLRGPEVEKLQSLKRNCKQTCLTFAPEEHIMFMIQDNQQACPLFQTEKPFLSSKLICHTNIFKRQSGTNAISASAHKTCRNLTNPWRILSQPQLDELGKIPWKIYLPKTDAKRHTILNNAISNK